MNLFTNASKTLLGNKMNTFLVIRRNLVDKKVTAKQFDALVAYAQTPQNIKSLQDALQAYSNNGAQTVWKNIPVQKEYFRLDIQGPYTADNWKMGANLNIQSDDASYAAVKVPFNGKQPGGDQQKVGVRNPSVNDARIKEVINGICNSLALTMDSTAQPVKVIQQVLSDFPK